MIGRFFFMSTKDVPRMEDSQACPFVIGEYACIHSFVGLEKNLGMHVLAYVHHMFALYVRRGCNFLYRSLCFMCTRHVSA
jgi:hypothetical protein